MSKTHCIPSRITYSIPTSLAVLLEVYRITVQVIQYRKEKITIPKGTTIAVLEPLNSEAATIAAVAEKSTEITEEKRTMLWEMANGTNVDLSEEEKECFYSLLLEYADIFAENRNDYGRTDIVQHGIFTGDHAPIRQQVRRLPPSRRTEV